MSESELPVAPNADGPVHPEYAPTPVSVPPGWYHDPDRDQLRWWDGLQWTDAVAAAHPSTQPGQSPDQEVAAIGQLVDGALPPSQGESRAASGRARNRLWLGVGALVAVLAVVGFVGCQAMRGGSIEVDYSLIILDDCSSWGYDDVTAGSQVEVTDGSGKILGFGDLQEVGECMYEATFKVDKSTDGVYRVTTGNENRGYLNYSRDDVVDGKLTVSATLGDLYE